MWIKNKGSLWQKEMPYAECKEAEMEHSQSNMEIIKQIMLKHETIFKEQVRMLHKLYQVQRLLMAEGRYTKFAVFASSAPPSSSTSSSLSFFTSEPMKIVNCKQEQGSHFYGNNTKNRIFHDKVNGHADLLKLSRKAQRTFDLELPAADYIDDEVQEGKLQEADLLSMHISIPFRTCAAEVIGEASEVHSRLDTGYVNKDIDKNDKRFHLLKPSRLGETIAENSSVLDHSSYNEETQFFTSLKQHDHFQQIQCNSEEPSLVGGLEINQESRLDSVPISTWQKSNNNHEKMDVEKGSVVSNGFVEVNSQQWDLPLQESVPSTNMLVNNSSTQNIQNLGSWSLPFFLQKQKMNMDPAEKENAKEHSTPGKEWSSVLGLQKHLLSTTETQSRFASSSEISHGRISQPASLNNDYHSSGVYSHHHDLACPNPYDPSLQLPESQVAVQTQSLFHTPTNTGVCKGSYDDWTRQSLFPSTITHRLKQLAYQPLVFPLTGQRTWTTTGNVGSKGVEPPANPYNFRVEISPKLALEGFDNTPNSVVCPRSSLCFNVSPLNLGGVKQQNDLCLVDMTADTELRLGPGDKLMGGKGKENVTVNISETETEHRVKISLQKMSSEEMNWEGRSLKETEFKREHSDRSHSLVSSIFGFHPIYTEERGNIKSMAQQGGNVCGVSTKLIPNQDLKVLNNGFIWREPVNKDLVRNGFDFSAIINEGDGMCMRRLPEVNKSENEERRNYDNASQHYSEVICKEHVQMLQNNCQLYNDSQEERSAQEIGPNLEDEKEYCRVGLKVDCETYTMSDSNTSGSVTRESCEKALSNKKGMDTLEGRENVSYLRKGSREMLSQSTLNVHSVENMFESRKDIAVLAAELDTAGVRNVKLASSDVEIPNLAGFNVSHDALHVIEYLESSVPLSCNNRSLVSSDDADDTDQVAEALLSLASSFVSDVKTSEDYASAEPEHSLALFANSVQGEHNSFQVEQMVHAPNGLSHKMNMIRVNGTSHCKDRRYTEEASSSGRHRKDNGKELCAPGNQKFLKFATIMLKASDMAIEQSQNILGNMAGEDSFKKSQSARRGRGSKADQKKILPNVASLSGREMKNIRGSMRSVTEVVLRRTASICRNEAANASTRKRFIRTAAGVRGDGSSFVKTTEERKGLSSWGDGTRRRHMRRHRSRWSFLASGIDASWEKHIGPLFS